MDNQDSKILSNQNVRNRKNYLPVLALAFSAVAISVVGLNLCSIAQNKPFSLERTIEKEKPRRIADKEEISFRIDGKTEKFIYSEEEVREKELNQGIVVWEKIMKRKEISYPVGHLYVFKDINSRNIVGKFAVSGGDLENSVHSITDEVYVLNKFESYPDYLDINGKIISKGGDAKNPWGYGRFYQYPIAEKGNLMEILSKHSFSRYINPDEKKDICMELQIVGNIMAFQRTQSDAREQLMKQ
jgi:hypothetical protein